MTHIYQNRRPLRKREKGNVLTLSLIVVIIAAGFSIALLTLATSTEQTARINSKRLTARSLAEAAIELGKNWCQQQFVNQNGAAVEAAAVASYEQLENESVWTDITVNGFQARYALVRVNPSLNPAPTVASPVQYVTNPSGWSIDGTDGVRSFHHVYAIYGRAEFTPKKGAGDSNTVIAQTSQIIENQVTPLFQYAVFYNQDLEILPGPSMKLTGRVHSNRDMYLGCGALLTMDTDYVRAVGKMYRKRKDDGSPSLGTVLIKNLANLADADASNDFKFTLPSGFTWPSRMFSKTELQTLGIGTASGFDSSFGGYDYNSNGKLTETQDWKTWGPQSMAFWGGTVQTSDMNVPFAAPPQQNTTTEPFMPKAGGDFDKDSFGNYIPVAPGTGAYGKGFFHSKAGFVVRDGIVYAPDGTDISSALLANTVTTSTIYDAREKKNVPQVKIDIGLLKQSLEQVGSSSALTKLKGSWNGLIFATNSTATATSPKGVLLTNGSELPNHPFTGVTTGLTVATNLPVYVHGDYNTKVNGSASATNDPAYRKPAAVIGDAVNLLSKNWNNSKTSGSGLPSATATTFNTAMIAGNTESVMGTVYSGGLENLPRFHENWSGVNCTIAGSFVNLWKSKIATGKWEYGGNIYTAPIRIWDFDPNYKNYTKIPPFTPLVVEVKEICTQQ
ncbi:MAG: hypothetical protein ACKVS6_15570 [Planctomycetota bacterium]